MERVEKIAQKARLRLRKSCKHNVFLKRQEAFFHSVSNFVSQEKNKITSWWREEFPGGEKNEKRIKKLNRDFSKGG
jgi:hypothetical protein